MNFHRLPHASAGWETIGRDPHFESEHLAVATEKVRSPAHPEPRSWTIVHRKAAVIIAPLTTDGKLILIRQERVPIRAAIWEMPAGQVDDANATEPSALEEVAWRELREETGYGPGAAGELLALGHYFSSPGLTDETGYFFLARNVEKTPGHHELEQSILDCRAFTLAEVRRMIADNEIHDANTLSLCAKLLATGHWQFSG